jgi:hypothetical protein
MDILPSPPARSERPGEGQGRGGSLRAVGP